ncbi:amino acid adenylation domain-containing protein [Streptomyces sp. NPDC014685]|uniref:non-ribosomal peptide synthetase n=1 Tax=Streptomyces sp. NPDC014685 TaxID=3364881 RepID=UPI0036F60734
MTLLPVHQQVAARAAARPDAPAVTSARGALSYRELDERANRLAHHLAALGVRPESRVAVHLQRSTESVVVQLAVLKAAGAYLPVDPAQPPARIAHVLADAAPAVLITRGPGEVPAPPGATHLDLIRDAAAVAARPATAPPVPVLPDNLAYVIHTSGSTGTPKGVMVPHRALANLVAWHVHRYGLGPGEHTAHVAALGFDAAVWEVWPALASGALLHLPDEEDRSRPERLLAWLAAEGITVTFLPTPVAQEVLRLPPAPSRLRAILTGGDTLTAAPPPGTPYELVNHYGPTEATVVTTAATVPAGAPGVPPIGRPIAEVRVQLLDEDARPVADGARGELYVGGAGVARGYLNRPGLTAERFLPDPSGPPGSRVYRTGDLAARRPDGALSFHGRSDEQVQVRGFRVEPAEVTAVLSGHPGVTRAAVVARFGSLFGYVVPRPGEGPALAEAVREHAAARLPAHMVPARVLLLDEIPLTVNGKIDHGALPDPLPPTPDVVVPPRDALEELIAETWYAVLELPERPAHVHDDFYALGGHSLLAGRLTVCLNDLFGVDLPLRTTFGAPTIAALAREVRAREPAPGHLADVTDRHRRVAAMSDEEVEKLLAELGEA